MGGRGKVGDWCPPGNFLAGGAMAGEVKNVTGNGGSRKGKKRKWKTLLFLSPMIKREKGNALLFPYFVPKALSIRKWSPKKKRRRIPNLFVFFKPTLAWKKEGGREDMEEGFSSLGILGIDAPSLPPSCGVSSGCSRGSTEIRPQTLSFLPFGARNFCPLSWLGGKGRRGENRHRNDDEAVFILYNLVLYV